MIPPLSRERAITQLAGERAMRQRRDIFASAYADKEAGRGLRDISATTEIRFYRQRGPERQLDIRRRRGNRSRELCRFYSPTTRPEKTVSRTTPTESAGDFHSVESWKLFHLSADFCVYDAYNVHRM